MAAKLSPLRQVDLEAGMPCVAQAMQRLEHELRRSRSMGCTAVKLIHGYGSSGKGGKIRTACRRRLTVLREEGAIRDFIPGERFSIFEEATRRALVHCADLRDDRDLDRYNHGVTFLLL